MNRTTTLFLVAICTILLTFGGACIEDSPNNKTANNLVKPTSDFLLKIDSLKKKIGHYKQKHDELNDSISLLYAQLTTVEKNQKVKVVYRTEKNKTASLQLNEKEQIIDQQEQKIANLQNYLANTKNELNKKNEIIAGLKQKVNASKKQSEYDLAKHISISDIEVKLYSKGLFKRNEKIKLIEFCFTINENQLADNEDKILYLCLTSGLDEDIIRNTETNTFNTIDGYKLHYTLKEKFYYDKKEMRYCLEWPKEEHKLKPGEYRIAFFIDRALAGMGKFKIE